MSMTGYGAAEGMVGDRRVAIEVRSVNHRFFNPSIKLAPPLAPLEGDVRERVHRRVVRGHVTVAARADREGSGGPIVDEARAAAYAAQLGALGERLGLSGGVDLATLLRLPDVLTTERGGDDAPVENGPVLAILDRALDALDLMRATEGEAIDSYLREHLAIVERVLERIAVRAPERLREQHARLRASVTELAGAAAVDPQRLAQEIALLADRLDVGEEVSRFRTHVAAFRATLDSRQRDGIGKRLGFLLQEMLREANTTGSKASDAETVADVVLIKEELERLREQSENVE